MQFMWTNLENNIGRYYIYIISVSVKLVASVAKTSAFIR